MSQDETQLDYKTVLADALEAIGEKSAAKQAMKSVAQYILRERGQHVIERYMKVPTTFRAHLMSTTMLYGMRP